MMSTLDIYLCWEITDYRTKGERRKGEDKRDGGKEEVLEERVR